jgi:hypothetical protein
MPQQDAMKRENKTIYEMITYLSGRALPGVLVEEQQQQISNDLGERAKLFRTNHAIFLKFLA